MQPSDSSCLRQPRAQAPQYPGSLDFLLLSSLPFLSSRPEPVCLRQVPRALEFPAVFAGAGRSLTAVRQLEGSLVAG